MTQQLQKPSSAFGKSSISNFSEEEACCGERRSDGLFQEFFEDDSVGDRSLKRLLALNEPSLDLQEALADAAGILNLSGDWQQDVSQAAETAQPNYVFSERVEWVLKWLLKKLNGSLRSPSNPRTAFQSWNLLAQLLSLAQVRTIAKLLAEFEFLDLLEATLTDANGLPVALPTISDPQDDPRPSKKRKRIHESFDSDSQSSHTNLDVLLQAIDQALTTVRARVESWENSQSTRWEREHLEAALRSSIDQSSRLLRLAQLQLLRIFNPGQQPACTLSNFVWLRSLAVSRSASDPLEAAVSFSSQCLVPSCRLLTNQLRNTHGSLDAATMMQIEELLIANVVLPARASYLTAASLRRQADDNSPFQQPFSTELLEPLHKEILDLGATYGRYSSRVKLILLAIPRIWSLALQRPPRNTPNRRRAEEPWLKGFFVALAECAGSSITGDWNIAVHPFSDVVLGDMLDACVQYSFSPGPLLLASAMRRFSGMCLPEEESIAWVLISKVLLLEPMTFVPGDASTSTLHEDDDTSPLHELILQHLSNMPWKDEFDQFTTAFSVAEMFSDALAPSSAAFQDQNHLAPAAFVTSVPARLLEAYSRARDLVPFLFLWRAELVKNTRHIVTGTGKCSVWEDHSLSLALRSVLEPTLSKDQILDAIDNLSRPFEELEEAQNVMYIFTELRQNAQGTGAAANLVLLDAIITSLHSQEVIDLVLDRLLTLYSNLEHMSSRSAINKLPLMNRVWSILANINSLLLGSNSRTSFIETSKEVIESGFHQIALEALRNATECGVSGASFDRAIHAADYILSLHTRNPRLAAAQEGIEACIDCVKVIDKLPRHCLVGRMLRHPYCWQSISPAQRRAFYGCLCARATGQNFPGEKAHEAQGMDPRYAPILDAVIELAKSKFASEARDDLLAAISFDIQHLSAKSDFGSRGVLAEAKLSRFPAFVIPRELREKCLNSLCYFLHAKAYPDSNTAQPIASSVIASHLSFMIHLMEVPNSTALLCADSNWLLQLTTDTQLLHHPESQSLLEELIRRVLHHLPPQSGFAEQLARNILSKDQQDRDRQTRCSALLAIRSLINKVGQDTRASLIQYEHSAFEKIKEQTLARMDEPQDASSAQNEELSLLLQSLRLYATDPHSTLEQHATVQQGSVQDAARELVQHYPASKTAVERYVLAKDDDSMLKTCLAVQESIRSSLPAQARRQLLDDLYVSLIKCGLEDRIGLIAGIANLVPEGKMSYPSLAVQEVLVKTLPRSIDGHHEFELKTDLLARLSAELVTCSDVRTFGAITACLQPLLAERRWLVTQYGMEALIDSLTLLTSGSAPALDQQYCGTIFTQICTIAEMAVLVHRIKLHGRFHIFLPLLINLLRCLFAPQARAKGAVDSRWPPWIQCKTPSLTPKHAAALVRLLSTLSSPTVSSVTTYKRRRTSSGVDAPLKDETKVERAYVGEYIPALLATYCRAQLSRPLPQELRQVLMPGLWAVMDTVEMDAWRAMSERLSDQERAIWQSLWVEWKKVGGGDRSGK